MAKKEVKTFKVKLVKSPIGRTQRQKDTVKGLGLTKLNQVKEVLDNDANRGMAHKIHHLVEIVEEAK